METLESTTVDGVEIRLVRQRATEDYGTTYYYRIQRDGNPNIVDPIEADLDQAKREYRAVVKTYKEKGVPESAKSTSGTESTGNFATGFSRKVNAVFKGSNDNDTEKTETFKGKPSKVQQFATSFSNKVNETVKGSGESSENESEDTSGFGALFGGGMDSDENSGPMLPGFGMQETDDDEDGGGPMLPGFGGGNQDGGPMLQGMEPSDDEEETAGPMVPGFGMWDDPDNDDDGENDYNFPGF